MPSDTDITALLIEWNEGNPLAREKLVPVVYAKLRELAAGYLRRERPDSTLSPTALVHEAYLKLVDQRRTQWRNRAHFFAVAATFMRRILVDQARRRLAERRGGGLAKVSYDDAFTVAAAGERPVELLALDGALEDLAAMDALQGRIVELRFFGGLTIDETAEATGTSPATVSREWTIARAWLYRRLSADAGPP
jgi:RNA polymerase sigma factor (TIGR02999 family)